MYVAVPVIVRISLTHVLESARSDGMSIVETDETISLRRMQGKAVFDPVRTIRTCLDAACFNFYPIPGIVLNFDIPVEFKQVLEAGVCLSLAMFAGDHAKTYHASISFATKPVNTRRLAGGSVATRRQESCDQRADRPGDEGVEGQSQSGTADGTVEEEAGGLIPQITLCTSSSRSGDPY
jgi:hypothetical protein